MLDQRQQKVAAMLKQTFIKFDAPVWEIRFSRYCIDYILLLDKFIQRNWKSEIRWLSILYDDAYILEFSLAVSIMLPFNRRR